MPTTARPVFPPADWQWVGLTGTPGRGTGPLKTQSLSWPRGAPGRTRVCMETGPAPCTDEAGAHLPSVRLQSRTLPFRLGEMRGGDRAPGSQLHGSPAEATLPPTPHTSAKSPHNLSVPRRCAVLMCMWLEIKGIFCVPACCPSPSSGPHVVPACCEEDSEAWSTGCGPRPATTSMSPSQVFIESGRNLSTFYENQLLNLRLFREARKFDFS